MRLICPNCGAQYEVPDDVIPEGGRDVQCSSCGHTWFERPGASAAAEAGLEEPRAETAPGDEAGSDGYDEAASWRPDPDPEPEADLEPEAATSDDADAEPEPEDTDPWEDDPHDGDDPDDWPADPGPEPEPAAEASPRPRLDPEVAEMMREEVALAAAARAAEQQSLESQPDLGLEDLSDDENRRSVEARRRMALLKGEVTDPPARGRQALPDIDEVSADLAAAPLPAKDGSAPSRPAETAPETQNSAELREAAQARYRSGFRRGFITVMALVVIGTLLYVYAPQIAERVPGLRGPLATYVEAVNSARLWLDLRLQGLIARLNG